MAKPAYLSYAHIPYPVHAKFDPYFNLIAHFEHISIVDGCDDGPGSVFFSTNSFFVRFSGVEAVVILSRSSKYCQ